MRIYWSLLIMFLISSVLFGAENSLLENSPVVPLTIKGDAYYNPQNRQVKFWGVNVVALYPSHETAVKIAADIASYGFNLVRPHHMMRPSLDWNTLSKITALVDYKSNTYTFDKEALDRFDFFNAELKKRGIYLALALRQSRNYLPADVDILSTDDKDRQDWIAAMNELNRWHWRKAIDARKLLPIFDERAAAVDMEFARRLLNHVNPYTGLAYGKDPQIISIEVINEATCEYSLICGVKERMPAYFQNKLQKRWEEFLKAKGVAFYNLWDASSREQTDMRTEFYRSLDQAYFARMKKFVRELGCNAPMLYTNLPHSEGNLKHQAQEAEVMETHCYDDPFVARAQKDMFKYLSKSQIKDKPLIIGELNEGEGNEKISQQQAYRTMLPVAMSAYGGLQNISGVVWFAWQHGDRLLDKDGNILPAGLSRDKARIGELMGDQMLLDHMRSCGIIFKNAFAAASSSPVVITIDEPLPAADYNELMRQKYEVKDGWQSIHAVRKVYGARPEEEAQQPWFTQQPQNPLISDTGQIIKDVQRKQLTLATDQAEAFSGMIDGALPAGLKHLEIKADNGFATVVLVSLDGKPLGQSGHLLISRTALNRELNEIEGCPLVLGSLGQGEWKVRLRRPAGFTQILEGFTGEDSLKLKSVEAGRLTLPTAGWHECELIRQ